MPKQSVIRDIATYHPSFLLKNPSLKKEVFEDLKKVRGLL